MDHRPVSLDIYHSLVLRLQPAYGEKEARALARMVVEDVLHLRFTHVIACIIPALDEAQTRLMDSAVERLLRHEPIQYITGHTTFCGLNIRVNKSVLIPRPETEGLVELAASLLPDDCSPTVMDACTGSGCIAITLKHRHPRWQVQACDISAAALDVARSNAQANDTDVTFSQTDILTDTLPPASLDLLVSNPPYVRRSEISAMESNVLDYEPHLALFVSDDDPLVFYRSLARQGKQALRSSGHLAVEVNTALADEAAELLEQHQYNNIRINNDLFGRPRFVTCQR